MNPYRGGWPYLLLAVSLSASPIAPAAASNGEDEKPAHHEADSLPATGGGSKQAEAEPKGPFDRTIEIKGTGVKIRFGGFAKVDFIQDFDPVGNADQFKVDSIPVAGDPDAELGGSTNISARQTRFSVDVRGDTSTGQVRAYLEGDFFGSGNSFRLRHGYGEYAGWLGGQTWTTFMDIEARPFTLDYEGPDSEVFVRQPMVRYTGNPSKRMEWSVAVEDPDSQVTIPASVTGSGRSEFPDIPGRVKFKSDRGHVQVSAILRQLRFVSDGGVIDETATAYGVNFSGKRSIGRRDAIMGEVAFGKGVGRYIESFGGTGSDAVLTPSGSLEAIDAWATVLGYQHYWNERFHSTISGGIAELDMEPGQPPDAIKMARSAHVNLVYALNRLFNFGGELMWGEREDVDGADGDALRLQFSLQYKFN